MFSSTVARLALAAMLVGPTIGVLATPAAAEPPTGPCVPAAVDQVTPPLQEPDPTSPSCEDEKDACFSGSAQEGIYGERYVPVEAVRMCMEAYRACIAAQPEEGDEGVG